MKGLPVHSLSRTEKVIVRRFPQADRRTYNCAMQSAGLKIGLFSRIVGIFEKNVKPHRRERLPNFLNVEYQSDRIQFHF